MKRQALFAGIGFTYAIAYGFWTMLVTGGGHGNFVWFKLFLYSGFLGLFFPVMGALITDVADKRARVVYLSLLSYYLMSSTGLLIAWTAGWINELFYEGFAETVETVGPGILIFCAFLHYLPAAILAVIFRSETQSHSVESSLDEMTSLGLGEK